MSPAAAIAALCAGVLIGLAAQRLRVSALARSAGDDGASGGPLSSSRAVLERLARLRRQAEDALEGAESELARLRAGLDELAIGVVLCDTAGNEILRNRRAVELAAARHGEALVAKAVEDLLAEARTGRAGSRRLELTQPRSAYEVWAMPLSVPSAGHGGGRPEREDSVSGDRPGPGGMLGAVALVQDITEQLRIERIRRDFVANVSHELKTPIGALALLVEALAADAGPAGEPLVQRIENQIERVTRTIDDLMMLSYIEEDSDRSEESADLASAVAGAVERIAEAAEQRGVTVIVGDRVSSAAPAVVRGSAVQLESAVFNLLDNAVKYSEPGGTVDVSVIADGEAVGVSVQDHGIGIPELEQERIFERFYRVDAARSRDTGGTGLGLSIVRHIALNHGGEVDVSSREGAGSVFTLRFATADAAAAGPGADNGGSGS